MFIALRQILADGWHTVRNRGFVGLFLFEFVVVMCGVLAAQGIANWSSRQTALERMEVAKAQWEEEAQRAVFASEAWLAAAPCIRQRMDETMTTLSSGPLRREVAVRPEVVGVLLEPPSDADLLLMGERYGQDYTERLKGVTGTAQWLDKSVVTTIDAWGRLAVAAEGRGAVSEMNRDSARISAAEIISQLRTIELTALNILQHAEHLGIDRNSRRMRKIESCDDLWATNAVAPQKVAQ